MFYTYIISFIDFMVLVLLVEKGIITHCVLTSKWSNNDHYMVCFILIQKHNEPTLGVNDILKNYNCTIEKWNSNYM